MRALLLSLLSFIGLYRAEHLLRSVCIKNSNYNVSDAKWQINKSCQKNKEQHILVRLMKQRYSTQHTSFILFGINFVVIREQPDVEG